jgi:hypothetical protein
MQRFCILQCACVDSRAWKAFATSGLQMLTISNGDAKSSELMVKAFLGASFQQPLFFHVRLSLHKNIWCKKDIGCIVQDGVQRKGFVKDVLRKHGA